MENFNIMPDQLPIGLKVKIYTQENGKTVTNSYTIAPDNANKVSKNIYDRLNQNTNNLYIKNK